MKRHSVNKRKSSRKFNRNTARTKMINLPGKAMRGGRRL